jgi:cytochrome c oxidase cbb3-type subunit 3
MRTYTVVLLALVFLSSFASAEPATSSNARTAAQLYRRYCVACHGNDGKGKTSKGRFNHARDLTDPQWHADVSDERIFNSIRNGRDVSGTMPPFGNKMNEKEVESLVVFVRGLKG